MPDGYRYSEIEVLDTPTRSAFNILYCNAEKEIWLKITKLDNPPTRTYEKDDADVEVYQANGVNYYIMQDFDLISTVWATGNCECSIRGYMSIEDMHNIIDSIYGE